MKHKIVIAVSLVIVLTALLGGIEALLFQDIPLLGFCLALVAMSYAALRLNNYLVPHDPQILKVCMKIVAGIPLLCIYCLALFLLGIFFDFLLPDIFLQSIIPLLCLLFAFFAVIYAAFRFNNFFVPRDPLTIRWLLKKIVAIPLLCTAWSALFASLYLFPSFFISTKTTHFTEPRLTEFYGVDFLVHFERDVQHEDNAARHIIAAMGYPRLMYWGYLEDKPKKYLYTKLGLPDDLEPTVYFTTYYSFYETLPEESRAILDARRRNAIIDIPLPHSDEERAIFQPLFEGNEPAFALIEEALQKPAFYIPPMYGRHCADDDDKYFPAVIWDVYRPIADYHDLLSDIARVYSMRCRYHLSLGNTEKAWHDVRQLYRLVALNQPGILTEHSLVRQQTLQFYANGAAESVLLYGNWSSEEIRQARQVIVDSYRPLTNADVQRVWEGERLYRLAFFQHLPRYFTFRNPLPSSILPIGRAMVATNRAFDELRENYNEKFESRGFDNSMGITDVFRLLGWYGLRGGVRNGLGEFTGSMNVDFLFRAVVNRADRLQTEMELTQLVFALELYQKEHENQYPPNLETLCNGYIEKVPVAPFSKVGESMVYKVNDDRTGYLLYSVGRNGIDDGGQHDNTCGNYIKSGAHFEDNLTYSRHHCYSYICVCDMSERDDIWRKRNYEID